MTAGLRGASVDLSRRPIAVPETLIWLHRTYLKPEIDRRVSAGAPPVLPFNRAQVMLKTGEPSQVRFNDEVPGELAGPARRDGGPLPVTGRSLSESAAVASYSLPDESGAGHFTVFLTPSGLHLALEGINDLNGVSAQLEAADEFIATAKIALDAPRWRSFVMSAFDAADLLARAQLLWFPDERSHRSKKHSTRRSIINEWANAGMIERRFATVLNDLTELREDARFGESGFTLEVERGAAYQAAIEEMRNVAEVRPSCTESMLPTHSVRIL
jgi:uncharacterized protein (UPF0332 family)